MDERGTVDGKTPLFGASYSGHLEVVELLLDAGADVTKMLDLGRTPLTLAISRGHVEAVKLLAMAGALLTRHTTNIARRNGQIAVASFLEEVEDYSPVQICVALNRGDRLRWLLRYKVYDPFARAPGTPALLELAVPHGDPMLQLCREVRSKWAPSRHWLFHPAHRSTVFIVLLVAKRRPQGRALAWSWVGNIPPEIWFVIIENLGRLAF